MPKFLKSVFTSMLGTLLALGLMFMMTLLMITSSVALFSRPKLTAIKSPSVLVIELGGELVEKEDPLYFNFREQLFFGGKARTNGLFDLQESLRLAATDNRIKGVLIHLDGMSSGISKVTSLKRSLEQFKQSGKPIVGYADSLGLTASYLATSFDKLYINKYISPDIRGVGFVPVFFKGTLDKLGIQTLTFRAGEYKSAVETFTRTNLSPKARENLDEIGADLWAELAGAHGRRWGLTPNELNKMAAELYFESPGSLLKFENVEVGESIHIVKSKMGEILAVENPSFVKYQKFLFTAMQSYLSLSSDTVAVVLAEGEIVDRGTSAGNLLVGNVWAKDFQDVCENKDVKALVVRINSPGGSAQASDIMDQAIAACAAKKPVMASFSDTAASGGYYMAARTTKVFAEPTTITGSIGVFGLIFQTKEFFDRWLGLTFDAVKTHPYADVGNPGRGLAPLEGARIDEQIDWVYDQFLSVVVKGRKLESVEALKPLAGGKVWTGARAHSVGLVDELGGLQEAISAAAESAGLSNYAVEFLPKPSNPLEMLLSEMGMEVLGKLNLWKAYSLVDEIQEKGQVHQIYTRVPWDFEGLTSR